MSKSVVLSSVLLSGSLCFVGVQLGKDVSSIVVSQPVGHVESVSVSGPAEPYIVEYDFLTMDNYSGSLVGIRIWSDGVVEYKNWFRTNFCDGDTLQCGSTNWSVLPGSSDGYACRSDIDGNRQVDFNDLLMVISDWSQPATCNPHPVIQCGKPAFQPPA